MNKGIYFYQGSKLIYNNIIGEESEIIFSIPTSP